MPKVKTSKAQARTKKTARKKVNKAQTTSDQYLQSSVRLIEGSGIKGRKARPFSAEAAIDEFRSWIFAAVMLNANAVASLPLRLYVRNRANRRKLWATRPVPLGRRRYLVGDRAQDGICPHRDVVRKVIEFGEDFEEVTESHPILDLIRTVNPWFNGFDLLQLAAIYLELTGNAYWHVVLNENGVPGELWPMPSQWTWVVPSRESFIEGYVYGRSVEIQQQFEVDEVIHFRTSSPGADGLFYGMGKVEAGWPVVNLNTSQHEMDIAFTDNHARPDYAVIVKQGATNDQLDRFEREIERKLRGNRNTGRFLSITGDVQVMPLNFPPKDLGGREETVEEIAAIFGTPVSLLKANDPNLASAQVGYAAWKSNSILPIARMIEQKLNERLIPMFGIEDDAVLAFDNPVPADKEFELQEATQLVQSGIMTRNEARADRGLDEVDGGDELLVTAGMMPLDEAGRPQFALPPIRLPQARPELPAPREEPREPVSDQDVQVTEAAVLNGAQIQAASGIVQAVALGQLPRDAGIAQIEILFNLTPQQATRIMGSAGTDAPTVANPGVSNGSDESPSLVQRPRIPALANRCHHPDPVNQKSLYYAVWKQDPDAVPQDELPGGTLEGSRVPGFQEQMRNVFTAQARALLDILGDDPQQWRAVLEAEGWAEEIKESARPFIEEAVQLGGEVAQISEAVRFDVFNPEVQNVVDTFSVRLADSVQGSTVHTMESIIGRSLEEGRTIRQISQQVREWGGPEVSSARAEMIARTESARAYVTGEVESWKQSGEVVGKKWLLSPEPCEFCRALATAFNRRSVGLTDVYLEKGSTLVGTEGGRLNINYDDVSGPPLHPNCRCDLIPILEGEQ